MPSSTTTFDGLPDNLRPSAERLAAGLGRNVAEFTFHHGGRHGSVWASLPSNDTKWLL